MLEKHLNYGGGEGFFKRKNRHKLRGRHSAVSHQLCEGQWHYNALFDNMPHKA